MTGVEQQTYTRARRTLFQKSEGYGTVAKSAGISETFVKENIHPYCVYPASYSSHPKVITVVQYMCGKMLLGQAVYIQKDFTGQRSTFLAHNYILPPKVACDVLHEIGQIFEVKFIEDYDVVIEIEDEHDVLSTLPTHAEKRCNYYRPPINTKTFNTILQCITDSVYKSKKTYVIVPVEPEDMHEYVAQLISEIYRNLPDEIKHLLGFCTYAREVVNKKGLHLIFLEKGSKINTASSDFIIDAGAVCELPKTAPIKPLNHILKLPPERFFPEINFWHIRTPHHSTLLHHLEIEWLDINLDKLTLSQFMLAPDLFLEKRKTSPQPELYVIFAILKKCAAAISNGIHLDLRYYLGSYALTANSHFRAVKNLRRLYSGHVTPANFENIAFLFRARCEGRLDISGLKDYLEKYTSSPEHMDAYMLIVR